MAIVAKVLTPDFFSKDEPYMFVFFVEELKPIYRSGACTNPRYMQVYDLRLIYPEASDVYEAKTLFMEEITKGFREAIKLHEFKISDLTNGKHTSVHNSYLDGTETHMRVGVYDGYNALGVAKKILYFCIEHRFFRWDD